MQFLAIFWSLLHYELMHTRTPQRTALHTRRVDCNKTVMPRAHDRGRKGERKIQEYQCEKQAIVHACSHRPLPLLPFLFRLLFVVSCSQLDRLLSSLLLATISLQQTAPRPYET